MGVSCLVLFCFFFSIILGFLGGLGEGGEKVWPLVGRGLGRGLINPIDL